VAGIKNNIMKTKYTIIAVISMIMVIVGIWILLKFPQTAWGLLISLTFTVSLGAGLHNLEKCLKNDQQNRNK
jgi:hypothetical protein